MVSRPSKVTGYTRKAPGSRLAAKVRISCKHCDWSGYRDQGSTQPCPSCLKPLDWLDAIRQRSEIQRRYTEKKKREAVGAEERMEAAKAKRLREEAERDRDIAMLLRAGEGDNRPVFTKRTP